MGRSRHVGLGGITNTYPMAGESPDPIPSDIDPGEDRSQSVRFSGEYTGWAFSAAATPLRGRSEFTLTVDVPQVPLTGIFQFFQLCLSESCWFCTPRESSPKAAAGRASNCVSLALLLRTIRVAKVAIRTPKGVSDWPCRKQARTSPNRPRARAANAAGGGRDREAHREAHREAYREAHQALFDTIVNRRSGRDVIEKGGAG